MLGNGTLMWLLWNTVKMVNRCVILFFSFLVIVSILSFYSFLSLNQLQVRTWFKAELNSHIDFLKQTTYKCNNPNYCIVSKFCSKLKHVLNPTEVWMIHNFNWMLIIVTLLVLRGAQRQDGWSTSLINIPVTVFSSVLSRYLKKLKDFNKLQW